MINHQKLIDRDKTKGGGLVCAKGYEMRVLPKNQMHLRIIIANQEDHGGEIVGANILPAYYVIMILNQEKEYQAMITFQIASELFNIMGVRRGILVNGNQHLLNRGFL
jgi:hypothetical protein